MTLDGIAWRLFLHPFLPKFQAARHLDCSIFVNKKNFGVLYTTPLDVVPLAPVYDIVTTTVYVKKDVPALSLAGTKKWWPRKMSERFAVAYLSLPAGMVSATFDRLAESVMDTRKWQFQRV